MQLGMLLEGHSSAPDSGKCLNGTADDIDEQYVRRNEIQRDKITVRMPQSSFISIEEAGCLSG